MRRRLAASLAEAIAVVRLALLARRAGPAEGEAATWPAAEIDARIHRSVAFCRHLGRALSWSGNLRRAVIGSAAPRALLRLSPYARDEWIRLNLLLRFAAGLELSSLVEWASDALRERAGSRPEALAECLRAYRTGLPPEAFLERGKRVAEQLPPDASAAYAPLAVERALLELQAGDVGGAMATVSSPRRTTRCARDFDWIAATCTALTSSAGPASGADSPAGPPRDTSIAVAVAVPAGVADERARWLVEHLAHRPGASEVAGTRAVPMLDSSTPALWPRAPGGSVRRVFFCGDVFETPYGLSALWRLPKDVTPVFFDVTIRSLERLEQHRLLLERSQPVGCGDLASVTKLTASGIAAFPLEQRAVPALAEAVMAAAPGCVHAAFAFAARPWVESARDAGRAAAATLATSSRVDLTATFAHLPQAAGLASDGRIDVVLAFDVGLLPHVPTTLTSLWTNTSSPLRGLCCVRGLGPEQKRAVMAAAGPVELVFLDMDAVTYPQGAHLAELTTSTLDRLLLPRLLPNLRRVIYLDVDLLVLADLRELWELPIEPHGFAARALIHPGYGPVGNVVRKIEGRSPAMSETLLRGAAERWNLVGDGFNAGVMVMDLDVLRGGRLCEDTLSLAVAFHLHDNEALVVQANGDFARLPCRWNYMPTIEHQDQPALVHWVGPLKPWLPRGRVRHQELWESYRRRAVRAARGRG